MITTTRYFVDAKGRALGRLASEISMLTQRITKLSATGQQQHTFHQIIVTNIRHVTLSGNKLHQKLYYKHSGHPGGLKRTRITDALNQKPEWVLRKAVSGMLPKDKLRSKRLQTIRIS